MADVPTCCGSATGHEIDDAALSAVHEAMPAGRFSIVTEGFDAEKTPWQDYLQRLAIAAQGIEQGEGQVAATFLVADVDGELVGRSSIRHSLNERLRREGGHIGYRVLPDHRPRGYATADLRQSLVVTRSLGIERCLITCADGSVALAAVIERNGGILEWAGPVHAERT